MSACDGFTAASLPALLIRHAARWAPPALAARLEEEWLADLAAQPSPFARLHFALGCCRATWVIACEHGAAGGPVATSSAGSLDLQPFLPHRAGALVLVVCAHLGAIHLLTASPVLHRLPAQSPVAFVTLQLEGTRPADTTWSPLPSDVPAQPERGSR